MRFAWLALGAALLVAAAQPTRAQAPSPEAAASLIANAMQSELPMESNGIVMRRVHAERDMLVITVELPADATDRNHSEYVDGFIIGACETQPNPLFESRVRLRIDTYNRGAAPRQSQVFTRCPPAPAS